MMVSKPSVPQGTSDRDIFISIHPEYVQQIVNRRKNHEYRKYLLPPTISRMWIYTTAPSSFVEYVAEISAGKTRGEVPEDGGLGNADFNAGDKTSNYGYEIIRLWRLKHPISLAQLKEKGYLKGPPQKYCYVKQTVLEDYPLGEQELVFGGEKRDDR